MADADATKPETIALTKKDERRAFIVLAFLLAPALTIALVGGWGFAIWFLQMIYGPPGAH